MHLNKRLLDFVQAITLLVFYQTFPSLQINVLCPDTTMFGNNSAYRINLNTLFRSLSSNATNNPSRYFQTTVKNPTSEPIYGHYLCRGDQNTESCNDCVTTATTIDLPKMYCPNRKVAIIWYAECIVRYSNDSFFNKMDKSVAWVLVSSDIIGNVTRFMDILGDMMNKVIAIQAPRGGPRKFAVDIANYTNNQTIYGLGQCTPDLTPTDCYVCLSSSIQQLKQSLGGQIMAPSCIIRYEVFPFFNLSYLSLPAQSSLSPSPSPSLPPSIDTNSITTSNGSREKKKVSARLFVPVIAALIVFSVAVFSISICLLRKKLTKDDAVIDDALVSDQDFSVESLQYDLTTLLSATNNFSNDNKLGEGGFGGVYKGVLSNGKLIAVKRLFASSSQGIKEFKSEVLLVAKLQHRNLVRLLGFCYTRQEKLLVYEHVANKSLDKFLFDPVNRRELDWQSRYKIVKGIARGMSYLHHDSWLTIVHRDLKASNILLDEEMNPKISDFGTSRIFGVDQNQINYTSKVIGTYGYMAPEYALHGQFSIKSDAYSFGMIVLEMISGRRNGAYNQPDGTVDLLSNAWEQWAAGTPLECVDPMIRESCSPTSDLIRCIHLGLLCLQDSVEDRPTMANVVLTLDGISATLPIPRQPSFFTRSRNESTISKEVGPLSVNDVSITELEPR